MIRALSGGGDTLPCQAHKVRGRDAFQWPWVTYKISHHPSSRPASSMVNELMIKGDVGDGVGAKRGRKEKYFRGWPISPTSTVEKREFGTVVGKLEDECWWGLQVERREKGKIERLTQNYLGTGWPVLCV